MKSYLEATHADNQVLKFIGTSPLYFFRLGVYGQIKCYNTFGLSEYCTYILYGFHDSVHGAVFAGGSCYPRAIAQVCALCSNKWNSGVKCTPTSNGLLTVLGITGKEESCVCLTSAKTKQSLSFQWRGSKEEPMFCTFPSIDVTVCLRPFTLKSWMVWVESGVSRDLLFNEWSASDWGESSGPKPFLWYAILVVAYVVCFPSRVSSLKSLLSVANCTNTPGDRFDGTITPCCSDCALISLARLVVINSTSL